MADQKVIEYVKKAQADGISKELVYKQLLGDGKSIEAIQEAYLSLLMDDSRVDTSKKTIRIIVAIATFLIGAGVFSFIAANWQGMSPVGKVAVILIAMLTSYGAGWYFNEKKSLVRTGSGLIILGAIIYGAGIFLVAQTFHIKANWPDGLILWMLGTIAMAYATNVFALFALSLPLGVLVGVGYPIGMSQHLNLNHYLYESTLLIVVATIVTFVTGLQLRNRIPKKVDEL